MGHERRRRKNLFPVGKYNINTQNPYKHQIFITAYRRLPESLGWSGLYPQRLVKNYLLMTV